MIAHVAQAGEDRGRVVVRLGAYAASSPAAIAAAVHVARAFQSEIEGLFVEDPLAFEAASRPFVRALSLTGAPRSDLSPSSLEYDTGHFAIAVQRELADAARAGRVEFSARVVRNDPIAALAEACAVRGPWNIIVFAEPILDDDRAGLVSAAACSVMGTTAYVAAGRSAAWRGGPVLIALEDTDRLTGMLRAAQRLAAVAGDDIIIQPVAGDDIALDWLEGEIRLTLGDIPGVKVSPRPPQTGSQAVWLAALAASSPRIVLARHGGLIVPASRARLPLASLGCPVFLVH